MAGARPVGVTIIGAVIVIEGILLLIGGVLGLFMGQDGVPWLVPVITGVIGLIYVLVARGLFRGSGGARLIVGILTLIALVIGVWTLLFYSGIRIQGLIQALIAIIILMVLWSPKAKAFFD